MKKLTFKTRDAFRAWLRKNHNKEKELWVIFYKKNAGVVSMPRDEALEEALCYGWIDSRVKGIDDKRYMQRYSPRKPNSVWSQVNKNLVKKLIQLKKMTKAGLKMVEAGKASGKWQKAYAMSGRIPMQRDLSAALNKHKKARTFFNSLSPSSRAQFINWINLAKRYETRKKRIDETVKRCAEGIKPGI